jgi:hypothetical protein
MKWSTIPHKGAPPFEPVAVVASRIGHAPPNPEVPECEHGWLDDGSCPDCDAARRVADAAADALPLSARAEPGILLTPDTVRNLLTASLVDCLLEAVRRLKEHA